MQKLQPRLPLIFEFLGLKNMMKEKDLIYTDRGLNVSYKLFLPQETESFDKLPLLVFLHGAGERGNNTSHLFRHGVPKLIGEGAEFPAVVLAPQCPTMFVWDNVVDIVKKIIDLTVSEYGISKSCIALTGCSMGGFGTFMMALTYPEFFSAIAPVAGGGMTWRASKLRTTPVTAFHGDADSIVPIVYSEMMIDAAKSAGGDAKLVRLDKLGHNDGIDYAYRNTGLIDWLLKQERNNFEHVPEICEDLF